jgi:hypothetical protein
MKPNIPWYLPMILGILFGILVWALCCLIERRDRAKKR